MHSRELIIDAGFLFAQAPGVSAESEGSPPFQDKTGEIDVSVQRIWETLDNLLDSFVDRLPFMVIAVVVFILFFFAASLVRKFIRRATSGRQSANLGKVLGRLAQWVLIFVGLIIAVAIVTPSVTPGNLIASLGVGGVAIGFAFKDILQNFMAGLLILLREPFKIGDQIVSGDYEGSVESIETRATMIKTYDGRRVVVPNSQIYTNPVVVNTAFETRRSQYDVGIGYGDDISRAIEVVLDVASSVHGVLSDPAADVLVSALAGSTVNLRVRWWTAPDQATVVKVRHEVIRGIKAALDREQIDMPYPTQVVLFHDQTEETDGDRRRQREGWPAGENPPQPRTLAGVMSRAENGQATVSENHS